jgi:hypothetical protein
VLVVCVFSGHSITIEPCSALCVFNKFDSAVYLRDKYVSHLTAIYSSKTKVSGHMICNIFDDFGGET